MENDSLNEENVAAQVAEPSEGNASQDDAALDSASAMPTPEQLGISITSGPEGGLPALTVGDTFEFPVTVSWSVQGSALLVVPASSVNAKGLSQVAMSQESSRSVKDGKEVASITFTYKIAAQDTGDLHVPALRFEIPTQVGRPIELRSESVDVRVNEPFNPLPIAVGALVAVCVLCAGLWRAKRRSSARAALAAKNAAENDLRERMTVLKQRLNVADSREWLLELEAVCKKYAFDRFGIAAGAEASSVNLEKLLKDGKLDGWDSLIEEFAHARYGGGKRDGFENRETWKLAMRLMGIVEE